MLAPKRTSERTSPLGAMAAVLLTPVVLGLAVPRGLGQESRVAPTALESRKASGAQWTASVVYDGTAGIWTVGVFDVLPLLGCPDIVGLDDKGRCTILAGYSGQWTPLQTVEDQEWLGGLAHLDLDPRREGAELYTGGRRGHLYQIWPHRTGGFDANLITRIPGEEIHTLVGGDLDPARPGQELLAFTHLGSVCLVLPAAGGGNAFTCERVGTVPGRVRDAILLPTGSGHTPRIAAVLRSGQVAILGCVAGSVVSETIHEAAMGFGRVACRRTAAGRPAVLYATRDDGVVVRLEERADGSFATEEIYLGPEGPRGVAAGRFDEDPDRETVAVFGYSKRVQILSRRGPGAWRVETAFEDRDRGHWLVAAELDGRNGTDELVASGFGSRIVLLSRPPGFGRRGPPVETPESAPAK